MGATRSGVAYPRYGDLAPVDPHRGNTIDDNTPQPDTGDKTAQPRPEPEKWAGLPAICIGMVAVALVSTFIATTSYSAAPAVADDSHSDPGRPEVVKPSKSASDDGKLKIEEHGYSDASEDSDGSRISWGAVVTNTSKRDLVSASVEIKAKNSAGEDAFSDELPTETGVPVLRPGESVGIGDTAFPEDSTMKDVKFDVAESIWWSSDDIGKTSRGAPGEPIDLEVSEVEVDDEAQADMVVHFKVDSDAKAIIKEPSASALFRDSKGEILGATASNDFDPKAEFPPGWSEQTLKVRNGLPEGVDESKVEIYAYGERLI